MEPEDIARLVLDFAKVLVWPAVATVAIVMFRRELTSLIGRVTKASGFGISVELENRVERLAAVSESIPELVDAPADQPARPLHPREGGHASEIGSLVIAWSGVEQIADRLGKRLDLFRPNPGRVVYELNRRGILGQEALDVARGLQGVRNRIVHSAGEVVLTPNFVEDFEESARNLRRTLLAAEQILDRQAE